MFKTLKISISKSQVRARNGKDLLLVTNNNINAYNKLWNALQGQDADKYILVHWGKEIACDNDKKSFIGTLKNWFEN
jgi:hypothetical protein